MVIFYIYLRPKRPKSETCTTVKCYLAAVPVAPTVTVTKTYLPAPLG